MRRDDPAAARPIVEESVALFREVGDRKGLALALFQLAIVVRLEGDHTRASALYDESLAVGRELGDKDLISAVLGSSGDAAQAQGDYERAVTLYQESLALAGPLEMKDVVAASLMGLAGIAGAVRQGQRAARLLSAGEALLNTIGLSVSVWPEVRAAYEQRKAAARAQLDEATFAVAWEEGAVMTLEQAIAEAERLRLDLETSNRREPDPR